ncbi:Hypothetical protein NTJ_10910 [Nesidiocoris tenuis]|uniref:Uncharacterized protein n=1 Tax=Nesidiocoris tenuis TaxID=355587 RepID=A0ABN7B109_9HEMI|nr:Hypothetical protein NTJ_10910 [Nesidiocoris tenuis]
MVFQNPALQARKGPPTRAPPEYPNKFARQNLKRKTPKPKLAIKTEQPIADQPSVERNQKLTQFIPTAAALAIRALVMRCRTSPNFDDLGTVGISAGLSVTGHQI